MDACQETQKVHDNIMGWKPKFFATMNCIQYAASIDAIAPRNFTMFKPRAFRPGRMSRRYLKKSI